MKNENEKCQSAIKRINGWRCYSCFIGDNFDVIQILKRLTGCRCVAPPHSPDFFVPMFFVTDINEDNLNWLFQVLLLHILQIVAIAVLLLAVSVFVISYLSYHDDDYDDEMMMINIFMMMMRWDGPLTRIWVGPLSKLLMPNPLPRTYHRHLHDDGGDVFWGNFIQKDPICSHIRVF